MNNETTRLSLSDIEKAEETGREMIEKGAVRPLKTAGSIFIDLCAEIRACWAELEGARKQLRTQFEQRQFVGEMIENMPMNRLIAENELLRKIAIAAAEQIAARPQLETPLLEAVEAWQKSNRDSA